MDDAKEKLRNKALTILTAIGDIVAGRTADTGSVSATRMTRILTSARPLGGAARPAPLSPAGSTAAAQTKYTFERIFVQYCLSTCEADWIGCHDEASTARDDAQLPSMR